MGKTAKERQAKRREVKKRRTCISGIFGQRSDKEGKKEAK